MNFKELKRKVDLAISKFYARDLGLLDITVSEWAIAHRIAVYLEELFEGWNVDCEYNRAGPSKLPKYARDGTNKRPDIVIHHRTMPEKEHNLLVIEIKTDNSSEDYSKLKDFTSSPNGARHFQYQYGLALSFKPRLKKKWFPEGELG